MMPSKKQAELDLKKWFASENAGKDLCGSFDFCAYCDKEEENPCANAYEKQRRVKSENCIKVNR